MSRLKSDKDKSEGGALVVGLVIGLIFSAVVAYVAYSAGYHKGVRAQMLYTRCIGEQTNLHRPASDFEKAVCRLYAKDNA